MQKHFLRQAGRLDSYGKVCDFAKNKINVVLQETAAISLPARRSGGV
jgi:hypothetical protein